MLNSVVVEACQSFQFLRQNTLFLENNRALPKFLNGILHYLLLTNYNKISLYKSSFIFISGGP